MRQRERSPATTARRKPPSAEELDAAPAFAQIASVALSSERCDQLGDVARVAGRLDLDAIVQRTTDAATALTGAQFGAFFYDVVRADGEAYTLYTISGVARQHFSSWGDGRARLVSAQTDCSLQRTEGDPARPSRSTHRRSRPDP